MEDGQVSRDFSLINSTWTYNSSDNRGCAILVCWTGSTIWNNAKSTKENDQKKWGFGLDSLNIAMLGGHHSNCRVTIATVGVTIATAGFSSTYHSRICWSRISQFRFLEGGKGKERERDQETIAAWRCVATCCSVLTNAWFLERHVRVKDPVVVGSRDGSVACLCGTSLIGKYKPGAPTVNVMEEMQVDYKTVLLLVDV